MSLRQKEKSESTHQEIKSAALAIFLEKGYKNTTIQDIVNASGYSTGSFYKHYESKRDVLIEIWNEHAVAFITQATEVIGKLKTPEELAGYLIDNANAFDRDERTIRLSQAAQEDLVMVDTRSHAVRDAAQRYISQITGLLNNFCPNTDQQILFSRASVLDSIQYAYSEMVRKKRGYSFNTEDLKANILLLLREWISEGKSE